MHLRRLELRDYRSWPALELDLEPGVNLLVGRNGFGKTNVVEAIGYLSRLRSHRVNGDSALVRIGADDARVSATTVNQGRQLQSHLLIKPHAGNLAQINRTRLKTPRELLGVTASVLFAPEDLALVKGEPAERRRFLDDLLAALSPRLAGVKADYDKVLKQRNALLKNSGLSLRRGYSDDDGASALATLDVWDGQLASLGSQIIAARMQLSALLTDKVAESYSSLAPESRPAAVSYVSTLSEAVSSPKELLDASVAEAVMLAELGRVRSKDIERGMTLVGPHRDDLLLFLGDQPAKGFASHGETWSFALSLRLAEFDMLKEHAGSDPILILDDVFAELDAKRREKLVTLASQAEQTFITAAVGDDVPDNLKGQISRRMVVEVDDTDDGRISRLSS